MYDIVKLMSQRKNKVMGGLKTKPVSTGSDQPL